MGLIIGKGIAKLKKYYRGYKRIAVVGLDGGGKTTMIYKMGF